MLLYGNGEHNEWQEGEVEADVSYFGERLKRKRVQAAAGKIPVCGFLI